MVLGIWGFWDWKIRDFWGFLGFSRLAVVVAGESGRRVTLSHSFGVALECGEVVMERASRSARARPREYVGGSRRLSPAPPTGGSSSRTCVLMARTAVQLSSALCSAVLSACLGGV